MSKLSNVEAWAIIVTGSVIFWAGIITLAVK